MQLETLSAATTSSDDEAIWQTMSSQPPLVRDTVHIWRAPLDRDENTVDRLFCTLAAEEQGRAQRFHFTEDRRRFTVARGTLRALLARYLRVDPSSISFSYNGYGKPSLRDYDSLRFNVSHSGGVALYAIGWEREVGVDVERLRPEFAGEAIAERFFSANEVAALKSLPRSALVRAFFDCWTRKEAYIKARGKGLSIPLDQFDVTLTPNESPAIRADRDSPTETGRWSLWGLSPGLGFAGAAAIEGHDCQLWCGQWPDEIPISSQ